MAQARTTTQPTDIDADTFVDNVENAGRREDAKVLLELMREVTGEQAVVYGNTVGFGTYHYRYESGREGDSVLTSFAPRKANMVVYIMPGFSEYGDLLANLGKHKTGSSCLYLGRLSNVDLDVLRELIDQSVRHMRRKYNVPPP